MNHKNLVSATAFCIIAGLSLSACGDAEFVTTEVPSVATKDDLGSCKRKNDGEIIIVDDELVAYKCTAKGWINIDEEESGSSTASSSSTKFSSSSEKVKGESSSSEEVESSSSEEVESSSSEQVSLCGSKKYDPEAEACINESIVDLDDVATCGSYKYDTTKYLCYNAELYSKDKGFKFCDDNAKKGDLYDSTKSFCVGLKAYPLCNGEKYEVSAKACLSNKLINRESYGVCGTEEYNKDEKVCDDEGYIHLKSDGYDVCTGSDDVAVVYKTADKFCSGGVLYDKCNGKIFTPQDKGSCNSDGNYYYTTTDGSFFEDLRDNHVYQYTTLFKDSADYIKKDWMMSDLAYSESGREGYKAGSRLYNQAESATACPAGWKLPTSDEYSEFFKLAKGKWTVDSYGVYTSDSAGADLKATTGWTKNGTDDYKLSYKPTGLASSATSSVTTTQNGFWFTADTSEKGSNIGGPMVLQLTYNSDGASISSRMGSYYFAIRCNKNYQ